MEKYIKFVLRYRIATLVLCFSITVMAFYIISFGVFASSIAKLFFGDHPDYIQYQRLASQYSNDEILIIAFEDDTLFTEKRLATLEDIIKRIGYIPDVEYVDSLLNAEQLSGEDDELIITPYRELVRDGKLSRKAIIEEINNNDFYSNLILSGSGRQTAIFVELKPDAERPAERGPEIVEEILQIFLKAGFRRDKLHLGGLQAQMAEVMYQSYRNISVLLPITIVVLFFIVYALYRQFMPVFLTMGIALIAVVWTLAFGVTLDREINIMMAMVPAIVLIVSFSDIVHLCSAYILELHAGLSKEDAILRSGTEVGRACFFTSLTTFVGFASMSFIPTPVFRQLGLVLGTGVGIALLLAMTLVPIIFSLVSEKHFLRTRKDSHMKDFLDIIIESCKNLSTAYPIYIVTAFAIVIIVSLIGISRMRIETDFSKRLNEDNHIRIAEDFFHKHFTGTNFLEVYLDTGREDGILDPEFLSKVDAFQTELEKHSNIDRVVSFVDLVKELHQAMATDLDLDDGAALPRSRQLVAQYLLLFEMSSDSELSRLLNFKRSQMRLSVRIKGHKFRETAKVGHDIKEIAKTFFPKNVRIDVTGIAYLIGNWLAFIVRGQQEGLGFAIISIAVMMITSMRSFRVGLLSMIPNLIPLITLGGYLGFTWGDVDSDTMAIGMMAIGLGVDDTIHFLNRLRYESLKGHDVATVLNNTFHFTGRAIIQTTIILTIGFLPFAMSDYFSTRLMGTLLPFTLITALIADLWLVPAMVKLGWLKFRSNRKH